MRYLGCWAGRLPLKFAYRALYVYKCKFIFNEMKGDVGMSLHEKEGNKKNLHQTYNPSLHLCFKKWFGLFGIGSERQDLLQNNCMLLVQEQRNKKIIVCR